MSIFIKYFTFRGIIMKKSILHKEIDNKNIIIGILYFILTIFPLIVFPTMSPVYVNSKFIILYSTAIFLLIVLFKDKKIKLYNGNILALIFLLTLLIATIFSDYKDVAFWGNHYRKEGFFTISIYVLLFIVSSSYFKINKMLWNLILISSTVMSCYGLLQFCGFDPIQYFALGEIKSSSVIGTIGNRNFFSTYVLIFLPIYLSYYIFYGGKKYLFCVTIMFSALICSQTRGGWVAFLIMSFIGLIFIIKRLDCLKRAIIVFIMFTIVFLVLNSSSLGAIKDRATTVIKEGKLFASTIIKNDKDLNGELGSGRVLIWKITYKAFKESLFLGQGPDTLSLRLQNDYYEEHMEFVEKSNQYIDKAHNEFLEYAVSGGIFTVISYILILSVILLGLFKNIKEDRNKILFIIIITFIVQSMFNISVVMVAPIVWIMLGCALKVSKDGIDSILF